MGESGRLRKFRQHTKNRLKCTTQHRDTDTIDIIIASRWNGAKSMMWITLKRTHQHCSSMLLFPSLSSICGGTTQQFLHSTSGQDVIGKLQSFRDQLKSVVDEARGSFRSAACIPCIPCIGTYSIVQSSDAIRCVKQEEYKATGTIKAADGTCLGTIEKKRTVRLLQGHLI